MLLFPAVVDHLKDMWIHLEGSSPKGVQKVDRVRPESGFVVPTPAKRVVRFASRWQVVAAAEVEPGFAFLQVANPVAARSVLPCIVTSSSICSVRLVRCSSKAGDGTTNFSDWFLATHFVGTSKYLSLIAASSSNDPDLSAEH